ncbi:hypothetical protein [Actinomyces capricornis]|uniref:N-acetylmuramoyl-L-alanine amidase family protein n=1 Tax=Actinomyces capricornis TaxID=2755559 RepID=A0ABN6K144_9ACTO|nr:hypothetical protein [Actinomyces capricornis]BDA63293.1 hypothetical protein MANAM107_01270 [Actinomyces capricornis]
MRLTHALSALGAFAVAAAGAAAPASAALPNPSDERCLSSGEACELAGFTVDPSAVLEAGRTATLTGTGCVLPPEVAAQHPRAQRVAFGELDFGGGPRGQEGDRPIDIVKDMTVKDDGTWTLTFDIPQDIEAAYPESEPSNSHLTLVCAYEYEPGGLPLVSRTISYVLSIDKPADKPSEEPPVAPAAPGWSKSGSTWYHTGATGQRTTGWFKDGASWYYLDPAKGGAMATGWAKVGGVWYHLSGSGAMTTGWLKDGASWYYLDPAKGGAMATGWAKVGGVWYHLSGSGAMTTGWLKDGASWYYLQPSGAMATGWAKVGGVWYHLSGSGAMTTGWLKDGASWYYLQPSGAMAADGVVRVGAELHRFDASGRWIGRIG